MDEMYNFYARDLPPDAVQDPRRMRRKSLKQFAD
jgi:hypothetical protein